MICPVPPKLHFNHLFTPKNKTKEKPTTNGLSYQTIIKTKMRTTHRRENDLRNALGLIWQLTVGTYETLYLP